MGINYIYDDDVIDIQLLAENKEREQAKLFHLLIRYLIHKPSQIGDKSVEVTNVMVGKNEWFILPYNFGIAVGKKLTEQKI